MASLMGRARLMSTAELCAAEFHVHSSFGSPPSPNVVSPRSLVAMRSEGHEKKHKKITKSERRVCPLIMLVFAIGAGFHGNVGLTDAETDLGGKQ